MSKRSSGLIVYVCVILPILIATLTLVLAIGFAAMDASHPRPDLPEMMVVFTGIIYCVVVIRFMRLAKTLFNSPSDAPAERHE